MPIDLRIMRLFATFNAPVVTVPEKVGLAVFAFEPRAVETAVDIGLAKSEVSSTLDNPTIAFVIPLTCPEKVGDTKGAYVDCAVVVVK